MAVGGFVIGALAVACCLQLLRSKYRLHLNAIPGPFLASFSNLWKVAAVYVEDMPGWAAEVHRKYGPVVRIGPNHVSFASPEAFQRIYLSRQAFPKSAFYEVAAPLYGGGPIENLFSLRDPEQHASLRRRIGALYTNTSVKDFEQNVDASVTAFLQSLAGQIQDGVTGIDMAKWIHFYAYDCLCQVNVSEPLGFIETGGDVKDKKGLGYIEAADTVFYMVGLFTQMPLLTYIMSQLRKIKPAEIAEPALAFTLKQVDARRNAPKTQKDMLGKLMALHQERPDKLSLREVTSAIWINLTAGHDVLAVTLRALLYYLARNPIIAQTLRNEILCAAADYDKSCIVPDSVISRLPYLDAVFQETLRFHPNTGEILERIVPDEGAVVDGYYIPGGTVVGVNAWVLHFNKDVFGYDADDFRPERWLDSSEEQKQEMRRYLFAFGAGSRSCIGKHIAMMMGKKLVFELYRYYGVDLKYPERSWRVHGSWVATQTQMDMVIHDI